MTRVRIKEYCRRFLGGRPETPPPLEALQTKPVPTEGQNSAKLEAESALRGAACSFSSLSECGTGDVGDLSPEVFDALALLNVYFFADLAYEGVNRASQRKKLLNRLQNAGYLTGVVDVESAAGEVQELYNDTLERHFVNHFPEGWRPTHDYWGAKCLAFNPGWDAPKHDAFFAGDSAGYYQTFDSSKALWEATREILDDL
jgi:hypothetical protein